MDVQLSSVGLGGAGAGCCFCDYLGDDMPFFETQDTPVPLVWLVHQHMLLGPCIWL